MRSGVLAVNCGNCERMPAVVWDFRMNSCANRMDVGIVVGRLREENQVWSAVAWLSQSECAWQLRKLAGNLLYHLCPVYREAVGCSSSRVRAHLT